ncbi:hypothetical protein ABIB82_001718 [Bradyrhizobium sp. i1.8.4]
MLPLRPFRRDEANDACEFAAPKRPKHHGAVREPLRKPADGMHALRLIRTAERLRAQAQRLETDVAIESSVGMHKAADLGGMHVHSVSQLAAAAWPIGRHIDRAVYREAWLF